MSDVGDAHDAREDRASRGCPCSCSATARAASSSCIYALEHQDELAGLICESFAFQVPAPDFALAVLKGLSHLAPHAHVLRLKNEDFSRDPGGRRGDERRSAHRQRECSRRRRSPRWCAPTSGSKREFPLITLPVLILHGTLDKATKPSGSQLFYDTAGSSDKTLKLYEGHFHDLLNDVGKEQVMADIQRWIAERDLEARGGQASLTRVRGEGKPCC